MTKKRALPLVPMPPNFKNHGNYTISVAKLGRHLADKAEEAGAYILTETTADKLLVEDRIVKGVRSGDKGRDREGIAHNPHAHLMFSERRNDGIERSRADWFSRADSRDPRGSPRTTNGADWLEPRSAHVAVGAEF